MVTSMTKPPPPPPGSDAAVAHGCLCPVMSNAQGHGATWECGHRKYWVNVACPLHNPSDTADWPYWERINP
jgi:hypothetical protein